MLNLPGTYFIHTILIGYKLIKDPFLNDINYLPLLVVPSGAIARTGKAIP
jgi:hypothetical protein